MLKTKKRSVELYLRRQGKNGSNMENIMNEEKEWDQVVDSDVLESPVKRVPRKEILEAKETGSLGVSVEMMVAGSKTSGLKW